MDSDRQPAQYALERIQELYAIERIAREQQLDATARQALRAQQAVPILDAFEKWLEDQQPRALPKSPLRKAIDYYLERRSKLRIYTQDGRLEIDNNLVENAIRPMALGRKNYLFACSHEAAQRAAMIYSLLGTCLNTR